MILRIFVLLLAVSWTAIAQTSFVTVARTVSVNPTNSRVIAPTNFWRANSNDIEQALSLPQRLAGISFSGVDTNATALALEAYAGASNAQAYAEGIGVVASNALPLGGGTMSQGAKIYWGSKAWLNLNPISSFIHSDNNAYTLTIQSPYSNSIYGTGVFAAVRQQADTNYFSIIQSTIDGGPAGLARFAGVRLTWNNLGGSNYTFWIREGRVDLGTNVTIFGDGSGLSGVVAAGSLSVGAFQEEITNYARRVAAPVAWNSAGNAGEVATGWADGTNYWYWFDADSNRWQRVHAEVWP